MRNKKILLFLLTITFGVIIGNKTVFAQVTKYQYLNSSFGVISEFNGGQPNATGVRYIRIFFDDAYVVNHSYTFSNTFSITTIGSEANFNFSANTAGINFGGAYVVSQPSSLQRLNSWQQSVSYYKQVASSFNYKATGTTSYTFLQYNLGKDMHVVGFAQESYSIQDKGDDTSQTIINSANNIVNNNNATTQIITNNDNKNTQKIIDSQNQTTDAINDLNDSVNDSNVDSANANAEANIDDFDIDSHGLGDIFNTVVTFIGNVANSTCSPLNFTLPIVHNEVSLPCMSTVYNNFPTFLTLYQLITTGIIAYRITINLFQKVKQLSDPSYDKIEVVQL